MRTLATYSLFAVLALFCVQGSTLADDPPENNADWLTWTVSDAAGDQISLGSYEDQTTFVIVFSASDEKSGTMMSKAAKYIRNHPAKASKVLAMCCDDTGPKALKLHLRQQEWSRRVKQWKDDQEAAQQQAQQANEEFVPGAMPDYLKQIEDELNDPVDLQTLMNFHFPFKAGCRCEEMWKWLKERFTGKPKAPRILKVNASGQVLQQWPDPPEEIGDVIGS
ncbi:MAG: hypothetical protein IPK87_00080 [Planctomycetes bacterium]|nr:hypothetical protein [Planctomycetota bacterium]